MDRLQDDLHIPEKQLAIGNNQPCKTVNHGKHLDSRFSSIRLAGYKKKAKKAKKVDIKRSQITIIKTGEFFNKFGQLFLKRYHLIFILSSASL